MSNTAWSDDNDQQVIRCIINKSRGKFSRSSEYNIETKYA